MYLMINGNRHSVSRRIVNGNTVKFLTVEPKPEKVSGKIQMYENNGFLISEDNVDNFLRSTYSGTLLTLTNIPEPVKMPEKVVELTPAEKRENAYDNDRVIEWDGKKLTVTKASQLWQYYASESNPKANALTELIAREKQAIREKYPDEELLEE